MLELSPATFGLLPAAVRRPAYRADSILPGILHLGAGAFHRAHQAVYTDDVLASGVRDWGIVAASLHSPGLRDALARQGHLYTVESSCTAGTDLRVIAAVQSVLVGQDNPAALIAALADPRIRIVSLTVTEKGYCLDPATGNLQTAHAAILHDLATPYAPRSVVGYICAALRARRAAGVKPFTLLSCDNLAGNGPVLKRVLMQFAALHDPDLAHYIENQVACPATMVDRIVPATTEADCQRVAGKLGLVDAVPVVCEAFSQWIIEDNFSLGRPDWTIAGATFVRDAAPWEVMKLRLLNGAHSSLAWLGLLAARETVASAMAVPEIARFLACLMRQEIAPAVPPPPGADISAYIDVLLQRFANPHLQHRTAQIASDSSQKLPQRLLPTIRVRRAAGRPYPLLALAIAAWMRCLCGRDDDRGALELKDPLADDLRRHVAECGSASGVLVARLCGVKAIFGDDLARDSAFQSAVAAAFESLRALGTRQALAQALAAHGTRG